MTLKFPLINTKMNVFVEDADRVRRKRNNRKPRPAVATTTDPQAVDAPGETKKDVLPQPVLMVEVENIVHDKFRQTEEVKVIFFIYTL